MQRAAAPSASARRPDPLRTLPLIGAALGTRRTRSVLTIGGVAFTTLLVLVLLAAHRSVATGVHAYVARAGLDLWVAPPGADNLIRSSGLLPAGADAAVAALPGVVAADPITRSFVTVQPLRGRAAAAHADRRLTLLAIGYATAGLGGPPRVVEGRAPEAAGEVALDRAAAFRLGARPGDSVRVNGRAARVVGLTRGTNLLATQFVFSGIEDARRDTGVPTGASFLAVRVAPGTDVDALAQVVRQRLAGTGVYDRDAFVANNLREVASGLLPLLALVAGLGVGVAAVLVVLLVQGLVEDRRSDIAVLLALGAGVPGIGIGLMARAASLVIAGGALGAAAAVALAAFLDRFVPSIELAYAPAHVGLVLLLFAVAGMAAAAVPVLRVRRIDPLDAFRS